MEFLKSIYNIQKKEVKSKHELSFVITQSYLIPEYHKIIIRNSKKKNIMNKYNANKITDNTLCNLCL